MKTLVKQMRLSLLGLFLVAMYACSDDNTIQPDPSPEYVSAEKYLEDIGFNGSVLIRKGNTDLLRKGFGMADKANNIQNDPSLIYRIGSVTKSFTSAALVHLMRDGLIENFDQPISDFDEDFPMGDQITIRHLLTHHSGIPDYIVGVEEYVEQNNYFFETDEIFEIIVEAVEDEGLAFTPGEYFSYSNSNYLILGLLIEELTGRSYQEYLQEKIYAPLSLSNTGKGPDDVFDVSRAKGYNEGVETSPYQMNIAYSAGELESTIEDLEKWGDAMLGDYFTTEEKQEVFAEPYEEDGVLTVGAGWFTVKTDQQLVYHHGGDIAGFTSFLLIHPESNGLIILLGNEEGKGEQRNQIMETILKNEF